MNLIQGRLNRATYWLGIAVIVAMVAVIAMVTHTNPHVGEVVLVGLSIPRLHDIGRSGWWVAAPLALEIVGIVGAFVLLPPGMVFEAIGAVVLVIFGLMIWLGAMPGQKEDNRFGSPPAPGLQFKRPDSAA